MSCVACSACVPGQRCSMHRPGPQHLDSHRWVRLAIGRERAKVTCLDCSAVLMWNPREHPEPNASKLHRCEPEARTPSKVATLANGVAKDRERANSRAEATKHVWSHDAKEAARSARDDRRKA